jgi:haloalkane dehalogenase
MSTSKFINVYGSKIHYIEEGCGDPILFLHNVPASSYLWRHIIPGISQLGRCIAPDLIGMGKSDKPDIGYRIFDHIKYIDGFIETLDLRNITLVTHGLGSIIGFDYARRNSKNILGLAFYEAYIGEVTDKNKFSLPVQQLKTLYKGQTSYQAIMTDSNLINKIFNMACLRRLTADELQVYRAPFLKPEDRKVLWQYLQDSPFGNAPEDIRQLIMNYTNFLQQSAIPKLMLYTIPGFVTPVANIEWCAQHLPQLSVVDLGEALHFVEESNPQSFYEALADWYSKKLKREELESIIN